MTQVWDLTLTEHMARQVRAWRVDQDGTWRVVASLADEAWGSDSGGNQIFGMELCEASAKLLNEDPNAEPWN